MRAKSAVSWLKIFLLNSPAAARRRRRPAAVVIDTSGVRRNLRTGAERRACAASGDDACRFLTHEIVQILSRFTLFSRPRAGRGWAAERDPELAAPRLSS